MMIRIRKMQISLALILLETIHCLAAHGDFSCLDGWLMNPVTGQCYYISQQYASFDVAEKSCKDMSSSLATIQSLDEHLFIQPLLFLERTMCSSHDDCSKYWIGLRNDFGKWMWTDGSAVLNNISFWGKEFPLNSHPLHCGYLSINQDVNDLSSYWKNDNCETPMRYICKKVSDCPVGFFHVPGVNNCYKLNVVFATWDDASTMCQKSNPRSTLAIVTTPAENDAVTKFLKIEFSKNGNYCISDIVHKQNVWIGGQRSDSNRCNVPLVWKPAFHMELPVQYTNWAPGQPDCSRGIEKCIHISQAWSYQWNDEICDSLRCFLCQAGL